MMSATPPALRTPRSAPPDRSPPAPSREPRSARKQRRTSAGKREQGGSARSLPARRVLRVVIRIVQHPPQLFQQRIDALPDGAADVEDLALGQRLHQLCQLVALIRREIHF